MIPFDDLPDVPNDQRPMDLFVKSKTTPEEKKIALKKGWVVKDVRLIKDPAEAIRATFEGARLGTVLLSDYDREILLSEAKMHGVLNAKQAVQKSDREEGKSIEETLNFSKSHARNKIKVIIPDIADLQNISKAEESK